MRILVVPIAILMVTSQVCHLCVTDLTHHWFTLGAASNFPRRTQTAAPSHSGIDHTQGLAMEENGHQSDPTGNLDMSSNRIHLGAKLEERFPRLKEDLRFVAEFTNLAMPSREDLQEHRDGIFEQLRSSEAGMESARSVVLVLRS